MTNPHKYNTPEWMVWRLKEWIGTHGGEDSTTLMVFEAQKTIERMQQELTDAAATISEVIEGKDKLYAALWPKYDDSRTRVKTLEVAMEHCLNWLPAECSAACEAAALLEKK